MLSTFHHVWLLILLSLCLSETDAGIIHTGSDSRLATRGDIGEFRSHDFYRTAWSDDVLTLSRNGYVYIHYNYTITGDRTNWTNRVRHKAKKLHRRDHILADPAFYWSSFAATDSRGATLIPLCYDNQQSIDTLAEYVAAGVDIWHRKLGCNSGILFDHAERLCTNPKTGVHILYVPDPNFSSHATVGARGDPTGGLSDPQYYLRLEDPARHEDLPYMDIVVHELGHVLGLAHEHLRADAYASGLRWDCTKIGGYQHMLNFLRQIRPVWPQGSLKAGLLVTEAEICWYGELSYPLRIPGWAGPAMIPWTFDPITRRNAIGTPSSYEPHGRFDWESIMIYKTGPNRIYFREDGAGTRHDITGSNFAISDGDRDAVKAMYPDIQ